MQSNSEKPNESNLNHNPLLGDGEQFSKSEMAPEMMKVKQSCLASLNLNPIWKWLIKYAVLIIELPPLRSAGQNLKNGGAFSGILKSSRE